MFLIGVCETAPDSFASFVRKRGARNLLGCFLGFSAGCLANELQMFEVPLTQGAKQPAPWGNDPQGLMQIKHSKCFWPRTLGAHLFKPVKTHQNSKCAMAVCSEFLTSRSSLARLGAHNFRCFSDPSLAKSGETDVCEAS